jgi:hypothetical protein
MSARLYVNVHTCIPINLHVYGVNVHVLLFMTTRVYMVKLHVYVVNVTCIGG